MYNYKGARNLDALYEFVTGGYKTSPDDTIPQPPSYMDIKMKEIRQMFDKYSQDNEHLKYLLEDFDHIISFRKNAAAALLILGAIIGFFFGMIVTLLWELERPINQRQQRRRKRLK